MLQTSQQVITNQLKEKTMTILEQIKNLNLINKSLLRSFRIHSTAGNYKIADTIRELMNDNTDKILELMKKA